MRRSLARWFHVTMLAMLGSVLVASCSSSTHPPLAGDSPGGGTTSTDASVSEEGSVMEGGPMPGLTCSPADGGGGCNALGFCTGQITVQESGALAPTLSGGPLPSGLYAMTAYVIYTGGDAGGPITTTGSWFKETMRFTAVAADDAGTDAGVVDGGVEAGTGVDASTSDAGPSTPVGWQNFVQTNIDAAPSTNSGTVNFSGNSLSIDTTCPMVATAIFVAQYSSSATGLVMRAKDPKGTSIITYTKISN